MEETMGAAYLKYTWMHLQFIILPSLNWAKR